MDSVNKTLYIPLYGKAYVSRKGIILQDPKAEEIWEKEGFPLKGKSASKWLAYNMGMRSAVFDEWVGSRLAETKGAVILHMGCGMDSRAERVDARENTWYDLDFPEVIRERRKYFRETEKYRMIAGDLRLPDWKKGIPSGEIAIVIMEGISMYFRPEELRQLLGEITDHFAQVHLLMDCYSTFGARASKYKNPINDVGVTTVYGMDDPGALAAETGLRYVAEHSLTPLKMIARLEPMERVIFSNLFAGKLAGKIYRLYEFQKA